MKVSQWAVMKLGEVGARAVIRIPNRTSVYQYASNSGRRAVYAFAPIERGPLPSDPSALPDFISDRSDLVRAAMFSIQQGSQTLNAIEIVRAFGGEPAPRYLVTLTIDEASALAVVEVRPEDDSDEYRDLVVRLLDGNDPPMRDEIVVPRLKLPEPETVVKQSDAAPPMDVYIDTAIDPVVAAEILAELSDYYTRLSGDDELVITDMGTLEDAAVHVQ